eukprot:1138406-Pelagomonas_calceolata.AAC.3
MMQAVKTLPTSIKKKRMPRAEAPCIPSTKRKKIPIGIRRFISVPATDQLEIRAVGYQCIPNISVQDRMSMKLQSKLYGCMGVKTKLFKGP